MDLILHYPVWRHATFDMLLNIGLGYEWSSFY